MSQVYAGRPARLDGVSDGFLIRRFQRHGDRAAFAALRYRYSALLEPRLTAPSQIKGGPHPGLVADDLGQAALEGFWQAVRSFDPDRGTFSAYARRCVENERTNAFRRGAADRHKHLNDAVALHRPIALGDGDVVQLHDVIPDPNENGDPAEKVLTWDAFRQIHFSDREAEAVAAEIRGDDEPERNAYNRAKRKANRASGGYSSKTGMECRLESNGHRRVKVASRGWPTRTADQDGIRGLGAFRAINASNGRDTARGGMPWPPRRKAEVGEVHPARLPQFQPQDRAAA